MNKYSFYAYMIIYLFIVNKKIFFLVIMIDKMKKI